MKKAAFIIALLLLIKPVLPVFEYILNYEYIIAELCENRDKPETHCNGKCHLMKELAKASENEKPLSEKKSLHAEAEILFFNICPEYSISDIPFFTNNKNITEYNNQYFHLNIIAVFHPPAFIF